MALPTLLVNSASGSDTAASGAGPGTALTGSAASTDVAGTTVTLDGSPDLSGVATDGSHVIFLNDTTAGARNFGKITAVDNGAKTVTVSNAFGGSLSGKSWAIGGKRASCFSTTSAKLFENNSGSGDAMPGWVIEMQSGHTETRSSAVSSRRAGDQVDGPITLRGEVGAATMPIVTFSNNGDHIQVRASHLVYRDFEMRNSNATKTASTGFNFVSGANIQLRNIRITHATDKVYNGLRLGGSTAVTIEECHFANCANDGISITVTPTSTRIKNNVIRACTLDGIEYAANAVATLSIEYNIIVFNGRDGIRLSTYTGTTQSRVEITNNVIHGNASDGIEFTQTSAQYGLMLGALVENNHLTFNGGYGINLSGSGWSDTIVAGCQTIIRNNNFVSNTSGKYNGMTVTSSLNEQTTDPSSGAASATTDYSGATGGTNFMSAVIKGTGYPLGGTLPVGSNSSSYSYKDIGLQHQDTGSGSSGGRRPVARILGT